MIRHYASRTVNALSSLFITGLLTLLPFAITIGLSTFFFKLLKNWFAPLQHLEELFPVLQNIPHSELIIGIGLIFLAGIVLKSLVIRYCISVFEMIVNQIPMVSLVYKSVKQMVNAFSAEEQESFRQVILVEFPRPGVYSIGFLTTKVSDHFSPNPTKTYYNVFLPTTPNPTTGYFLIVAEGEYITTKLTTQDAMALIVSGGIIQPDKCKVD